MGRNDSLLLRTLDFTESQVYYSVLTLTNSPTKQFTLLRTVYLQAYFLAHPIDGAMVHCISITKNIEYSLYLAREKERK